MTISINVSTWAELEELCKAVLQKPKAEAVQTIAEAVGEKQAEPAKAENAEQKPAKPEQKAEKTEPKTEKASAPAVSMEDIKRKALALMDAGKQPDLEKLLHKYGVQSLPELEADPLKLAAFAADLEAM